eukprot:1024883-Lingulodinium_polyedra.AAC.1
MPDWAHGLHEDEHAWVIARPAVPKVLHGSHERASPCRRRIHQPVDCRVELKEAPRIHPGAV